MYSGFCFVLGGGWVVVVVVVCVQEWSFSALLGLRAWEAWGLLFTKV